jgi:polyisoprenoid-binding protein YceI
VWYRYVILLGALAVGLPGVTMAESYAVDATESFLTFTISNLGINTVDGRFHEFDGQLDWNGIVEELELTGTITVASIDTGIRLRDRHLRGSDYFDADTYSLITYRSTSAVRDNGVIRILGDLGIKDVTREVALTATIAPSPPPDALPAEVILTVHGTIDRRPFGVVPDGVGGRMIGETVDARGRFVGRSRGKGLGD